MLDLDVLEETRAEKEAERDAIGGADPAVIAKYERVQSEVRLVPSTVRASPSLIADVPAFDADQSAHRGGARLGARGEEDREKDQEHSSVYPELRSCSSFLRH